jgi:uncharacterized paraquat-inducible protein A
VNAVDQSPSVLHILTVYAFGIVGGSCYGAASVTTYALVWHSRGQDLALAALAGGMFGGVAGMVSLFWVMYLLVESKLSRSIPVVFAVTMIAAGVSGLVWFAPLFVVPAANIAACVYAYRRHNSVKWRRRRNVCIACEYDLRGLTTPRCPECGILQRRISATMEVPRVALSEDEAESRDT